MSIVPWFRSVVPVIAAVDGTTPIPFTVYRPLERFSAIAHVPSATVNAVEHVPPGIETFLTVPVDVLVAVNFSVAPATPVLQISSPPVCADATPAHKADRIIVAAIA